MTVILAMMRGRLENQQIRTSSGRFVLERENSTGIASSVDDFKTMFIF